MSNALARRLSVVLLAAVFLFSAASALTALPVSGADAQATETESAPFVSTTYPPSTPTVEDASQDVALYKVDPSLRDLVLGGAKDDVEVLVFSTDVPALARAMAKYEYEGLLGTKAKKADYPVAIYLKLPAHALREVSTLEGTLYIVQERVLQLDVAEASAEVVGAERPAAPARVTLSPEEVRARKLDLTARRDAAQSTLDIGGPTPASDPAPGMEPTASFSSQIHRGIDANANGYTGSGVRVAVVDQGVDFGHPELFGTWALFDVSTVPAPILAQKPYLVEYDGWALALNPIGLASYLANEGALSASQGFTATDTMLPGVTIGPDRFVQWNRDSPLVTPLDFLGIPMNGAWQGTGYPDVYFNPAEPVTPQPFSVPAGTVQMNIVVPFTCGDIDAALVYDTDDDGVPELGELIAYEQTSTGANPEVFLPIMSPASANTWWVLLLAFDATACTADVNIQFISIATQLTNYRVTGITSISNEYHVGRHWDSRLASRYFILPGVLVTDPLQAGRYEAVYVDLDNDFDFTDETAIVRGNPVANKDIPVDLDGDGVPEAPDGYADLSSGAVVHITNAGSRTLVSATVGNTSVSGTTARLGDIWGQLPDGNLIVNRDPAIYLNTAPWDVVNVIDEVLSVTAGSQSLRLSVHSNIVDDSWALQGTNIEVIDERPLTIADPGVDTSFSVRNTGLLNINVWRERTSPDWYGPKLVRLIQGQDYNVILASGAVTLLPRIVSNPDPFLQNMAGDVMRAYYNYSGTISLQDYDVDPTTGQITMQYPLKGTSTVQADYQYNAWTLDRLTGNLTFTVPLQAGDQVTATYQYGVTPIPYSDRLTEMTGADNWYWGSGDLVVFTGAFAGSHGTNVATFIAGQGVMNSLRPDPPNNAVVISVPSRFRGMAPDAKLVNIPVGVGATGISTTASMRGWYFSVEGYDGVVGTGDEAQIISNSWGSSPSLDSGLGSIERMGDWITREYAGGRSIIVKSAGNDGYGYGTLSDVGTPGIVTVGGNGNWYYRTQPEFRFDRGPNPSYGDMAGFSSWGPTGAGQMGVDILFSGQFVYAASPLNNFFDATDSWALTSGTSFSAPLASGTLATIYDAYMQAHGRFPDTDTAKELLLSGADRNNFDPFMQGTGLGNALRSTDLAALRGGIRASPYAWYPGDYRNLDFPASVHLLSPGGADTGSITLTNEGTAPASVTLGATEFQYQDRLTYSFTPSVPRPFMPGGNNWTIVRRGVISDWFGRQLATYNPALWDNADVLRVTAYYSQATFGSAARTIFLEPFDWTDVNNNLRFWGQTTNVTAVDWCADGTRFASGGTGTTVTIWDAATGLPLREISVAHAVAPNGYTNDIDWSPNCGLLAVATGNLATLDHGLVHVFNTTTWTRIRVHSDLSGSVYPISSVEFSPDGTRYAFTSYVNTLLRMLSDLPATDTSVFRDILVRSSATGGLVSVASGHKDVPNDVAWSANSSWVISGAGDTDWLWDNSVLVFDVRTNPATLVTGFSGHLDTSSSGIPVDGAKAVGLHPDGVRAFSAGLDDIVNVWDVTASPAPIVDVYLATGGDVIIPLSNPNVMPLSYSVTRNAAPVNELNAFLGTGDYVLFAELGLMLWLGIDSGPLNAGDVVTITYRSQPPMDFETQSGPDSLAVSPNGATVIAGSFAAANAVLYNAAAGFAPLATVTPVLDANGVVSVGYSANPAWAFTASYGGELDQWSTATGALIQGPPDWNGIPISPYGLTGALLERNRMGVYTPGGNVFEMRIHDPATRTHDGLAVWWRHLAGPAVNTPVTVEIEFFRRAPWTWITGVPAGATVNPGATFTFSPAVTVPSNAPIGLYNGQIEVDNAGDITTIPVVVNVALEGASVFDVGIAGPRRLYDNTQVRSFGGEWPDTRFYFFDTPDTFRMHTGQKWTVDLSVASEDGYVVPRHAQQASEDPFLGLVFGGLNASRYGPFTVEETDVGAPGFFKKSLDWRGVGNGVFRGLTAGPGLNILSLGTNVLNGSAGGESYVGETGLMTLSPFPLTVSTSETTSTATVSLTTTTPWEVGPDPFESSYGKGIGVATTTSVETITADLPVDSYCPAGLPRCEGSMTFQEYLFGAPNRLRTDVPAGAMTAGWTMLFHGGARDVDYGLWYDNDCDASYTIDDDAAGSVGATGNNPEAIGLTFPDEGCYWLHAAGFDVDPSGAMYDLTFAVTVIGASAFVPTDIPTSTIPANSYTEFKIAWDLPSTTEDGVMSSAFFISPGNAPLALAILVPMSLRIDHVAPVVKDMSPVPGATITNNRPTIVSTVNDTTLELDPYSGRMWVDGVDVTHLTRQTPQFSTGDPAESTCCYSQLTIVYDPPAPLGEGRHTARVEGKDLAGNTVSTEWAWFVDTEAPKLLVTSPAGDTVQRASSITVTGTTEVGAALTVAGQPVAVDGDGSFSATLALGYGENLIVFSATDATGHSSRVDRTVVVDTYVPALTVRSSEPSRTRAETTVISGTVNESVASVVLNGLDVPVHVDGTYSIRLPLVEGVNTFNVVATDLAGNQATSSVAVERDTVAPEIVINPVAPITNLDTIRTNVTGTVTASDIYLVTVNGVAVQVAADGTFRREITLSLGSNVVVVEATDNVGNRAVASTSVTYAPVIENVQRSYTSVIMMAVAVVLLIVGFFVGWMLKGRGGPPAEAPPVEEPRPPAPEEPRAPEPEEMPAEEEITSEEDEL